LLQFVVKLQILRGILDDFFTIFALLILKIANLLGVIFGELLCFENAV